MKCCQRCGIEGPPRSVTYRRDVAGWDFPNPRKPPAWPSQVLLCMSCWGHARAVKNQQAYVETIGRLTRQIGREIYRRSRHGTPAY